jgi:hypothetical protein
VPLQNREPIAEVEPLPAEEVTNLVELRIRAASFLEELAFPPPPGGFGAVSTTLDVLLRRGVLDNTQAEALGQLIAIADEAARGATVPKRVGQAVQNSGQAILVQLDKLRAVAGPKFEDHVLDMLRNRLPADWTLDIDQAIPRDMSQTPDPVHARVDALVTARNQRAVVEVRARLRPGADGQIQAVRDWLAALPPELPILLVMLGEQLTERELRWIRSAHEGPVELLQWDRESGELVMMLRELLDRSAVTAGLIAQQTAG